MTDVMCTLDRRNFSKFKFLFENATDTPDHNALPWACVDCSSQGRYPSPLPRMS